MSTYDDHDDHAGHVVGGVFSRRFTRSALADILAALLFVAFNIALRIVAILAVTGGYLAISGHGFRLTIGAVPLPAMAAGFLGAVLLADATVNAVRLGRSVLNLRAIRARRAGMTEVEREDDRRAMRAGVRARLAWQVSLANRVRTWWWWFYATVRAFYIAGFALLIGAEHGILSGAVTAVVTTVAYVAVDEWGLRQQDHTARMAAFNDPYPPRDTPEM